MSKARNLNFHGDDVVPSAPQEALFHVIPVPFEASVSYGTGTAAGPAAVLEASAQLERFTGKNVPAEHGLYTCAPLDCTGGWEQVRKRIEAHVAETARLQKVPVVLGGEHTISCAVASALQKTGRRFGVIHFDAHADLRDRYQGSPYSHACVMRRIHELGIPVCQFGTRSYCEEEHAYRLSSGIYFLDSEDLWKDGLDFALPGDFPDSVYLSFDVDCLDSSVMPATGTPVPGGLSWYQALWLVEKILNQRICIGFDVVEYAPLAGMHGPSFTVAQLVYTMMGYLSGSAVNRRFYGLQEKRPPT